MKAIFNRIKKSVVLMVATIVLLTAVVGGSLAWLISETGIITNIFSAPTVDIDINEKIDNDVKESVKIKNNSDIPVYIRVAVVVTWKDADGNVYPQAPLSGTDYTWELLSGDNKDWFETDGFYYYKKPVAVSGETTELLKNVKEVAANTPEGYNLSVEIISQAIQANPESAVKDAWGIDVVDGNLTKSQG